MDIIANVMRAQLRPTHILYAKKSVMPKVNAIVITVF